MAQNAKTSLVAIIGAKDEASPTLDTIEKKAEKMSKSLVKGSKEVDSANEKNSASFTKKRARLSGLQMASDRFRTTTSKLSRAMEHLNAKVTKSGIVMSVLTRKKISDSRVTKALTVANRRFRMEFLSIMFAGMALQRTFGGMVSRVLEMTGLFDVWRAVLTMILFPLLMPMVQWLMRLMLTLSKNKELSKTVGKFIIFMAVLGTILAIVGQVALGLGGILKLAGDTGLALSGVFGEGGALSGVSAFVSSSIGAFLALLAVVIVVALGIWKAFKEKFANIGDFAKNIFDGLKKAWSGVKDFFVGIWKALMAILDGDFQGFLDGLNLAIGGALNIIKGLITAAINAIIVVGIGAFRIVAGVWNTIIDGLSKIRGLGFLSGIKIPTGAGTFQEQTGVNLHLPQPVPTRQFGGFVPRTGLYQLHAGETVTPAGGTTFNGGDIIINANVSSDMDIKHLADRLSKEMGNNFERDTGVRAVR